MSRCPACGHETVGARCVVCGAPTPEAVDDTVWSPWTAGESPTQVGFPPTPLYPDDAHPPQAAPPPGSWAPQHPWQQQGWPQAGPATGPAVPPTAATGGGASSVARGLAVGAGAGALLLVVLAAVVLPGLQRGPDGTPATPAGTSAKAAPATTPPPMTATLPARGGAPASAQAPTAPPNPELADLQPGVGQRLHQVQVTTPAALPSGRSVVVWVSPQRDGGPDRARTYPYAVLGAGDSRSVTLHLGDEGSADIGARYVVEACVAGGSTLARVNGYLDELARHGPAEEDLRAEGIALTPGSGEYTCTAQAALLLTRTA